MKINLISPQTPFLEAIAFPPLNLLYLDSYIKKYGYTDTKIVDLNISTKIPEADVNIISATTPQFPYALSLLPKIKGVNIIGGAHASADPKSCGGFDKVVIGNGENCIIKCMKDIEINAVRHTYIGTQIPNLDDLPMPDRSVLDVNKYEYYIDGKLSTIAMTSRGCPYRCLFCQKMNEGVRFHSTKYVLKEIEHIIGCGYQGIYFEDDIFTMRKDLTELSCTLRYISWRCQIRPDENIRKIRTLANGGCTDVSIGIESGSQKILDIVNKKADITKVKHLMQVCKKNGIKVRAYIIVGLPGENHQTINATIEFLRETEPESVGVGTFIPYPGTYIYQNILNFDIKIEEPDYTKWFFRAGRGKYNCVVSTSGLTSEEILQYRDMIDKEFNSLTE